MHCRTASAFALLGAVIGANAQVAQYSPQGSSGISYSVNVPSSTSSTDSGAIYFQMVAPNGISWLGLGEGNRMSGANIFIIYASGNGNVTLSTRLGTGEVQPAYNPEAQVTLLEGSGVSSSGVMTANVRCDNCLSWSGGTMDPTSSSSSWIWASKKGSAIDSTDTSANLAQHDNRGKFSFNLKAGTGGSSSNPFIQATPDDESSSAASSASATSALATSTSTTGSGSASRSASHVRVTSSTSATSSSSPASTSASTSSSATGSAFGSSSGSSSESSSLGMSTDDLRRRAHGLLMAICFVVIIPLAAMTVYLPFAMKILFVHVPLQILSIVLLIAGMAEGVLLARPLGETGGYHQVIGYVVIAMMILFQPALGFFQHMHFRKTGGRGMFGYAHQWMGRTLILLGIINGGIGFYVSGPIGNTDAPKWAVIAYSVVAGVIGLLYLGLVFSSAMRSGGINRKLPQETANSHGAYRLHSQKYESEESKMEG